MILTKELKLGKLLAVWFLHYFSLLIAPRWMEIRPIACWELWNVKMLLANSFAIWRENQCFLDKQKKLAVNRNVFVNVYMK